MYFLTILLLLLLMLIFAVTVMLALFPVKIFAAANSEQLPEFHLIFTWLKPLLKGTVEKRNDGMLLKIYMFDRNVLTRTIQNQGTSVTEMLNNIRDAHLKSIRMDASYGFEDPSITGMVFGAVNLVSDYLDIEIENNHPEFNSWEDHFNIRVSAEANPFDLITGFLRNRSKTTKMNPLYGGR